MRRMRSANPTGYAYCDKPGGWPVIATLFFDGNLQLKK